MKRTLTVALVALAVVASMIAGASVGALASGVGAPAQPPNDSNLPEHSPLAAESIDEDIPGELNSELPVSDSELVDRSRGHMTAANHADTMNATWIAVNKKTGRQIDQNAANAILNGDDDVPLAIAIVMGDDVAHEGRDVAIPIEIIEESVGYRPAKAYGTHSSGDQWNSTIGYEDGYAIWEVPKFSENTITWSSEVSITGNPSSDGAQYQYNVSDADSVSGYDINITGWDSTEVDSSSAAGLANGDTLALDVAGNSEATGVEVTFTGRNQTQSRSYTGSRSTNGTSESVTVSGNLDPEGTANGDPEVSVSSHKNIRTWTPDNDIIIGDGASNTKTVDVSTANVEYIDTLHVQGENYYSDSCRDVEISVEGTIAGTRTWCNSDGFKTETFSGLGITGYANGNVNITFSDAGGTGKFRVRDSSWSNPHDVDFESGQPSSISADADGSGGSASLGSGGTAALPMGTDTSSVSFTFDDTTGGYIDYTLDYQDISASEDPAIDVDTDGTMDASYNGIMMDGETATYSVQNLAVGSAPADLSLTHGAVDVEVTMIEHTITEDVDVVVNGNATTHTGTLSPGSTTSLTTDLSWVREGENRVNVTVGNGTLSADAPSPLVGLNYSHESSDGRSVQYDAEQWSERYGVSKTYPDDRRSAQLRIPFQATVHEIRDIETRVNGGDWTEPGSLTYDTIGNDLVVDLGSVNAGDTVGVRAVGSRVKVQNGSVEVYDPTLPGGTLDTDIRLNSWSGGDSYILVGDTTHGDKIHFAYETSWTNADDHVIVKSNGEQQLRLPGGGAGSEVRVQTIPVRVTPQTGDARIEVSTTDDQEPEFDVSSGEQQGDDVDYTFVDAQHDTDYELYSKTHEVTRDFGTAQSPLTLSDDDSDETLIFRLAGSGDSTSDDGGGGGGALLPGTGDGGESLGSQLPLLAGGAIAVLTAAILIRRRVGTWAEDRATTSSSTGGIISKITGVIADVLVAFADAVFTLGGAIRSALQTRVGKIAVVSAVVLSAFAFDIITFTSQERVVLLGVTILLGAFVGLRRFGQFSWPLYSVITAATTIFVLSAMGTDLLGQLINSPIFPIVGIGGLYLGYKALQSWREGQKTVVQVRGE